MSELFVDEIPACRLADCWSLVSLETGELYHLGGDGAALIWLHRAEAELAAERLGGRYVAVRVVAE